MEVAGCAADGLWLVFFSKADVSRSSIAFNAVLSGTFLLGVALYALPF